MLESVVYRPDPVLMPYVAAVVGYRHEGLPPGVHRGLPSPYLTLVVTADEPLHLAAHADPRQPPMAYDALIGGLHTRPVLITHPGRQWGVQVSLTPLGARALLGAPAAALASWDAHKVAARVARFDRARRWLARRVTNGGSPDLATLAVASGYYDQAHLAREWRSLSGLPPSRWVAAELGFVQDAAAAARAESAA